MKKRLISALAALAMAVIGVPLGSAPAYATANQLTVVSSGGAAENSGWTYSAGVLTATATVSVNASDLVSKLGLASLDVVADKIIVSASVVYGNSSALRLKSTGSILVGGGVTLQSGGGDIVLDSDSDANDTGDIRLGLDSVSAAGAINTNGGRIILGGGADPLNNYTAAVQADVPTNSACGGIPPTTGLGIYGFALNAGGGDIVMHGGSPALGTTVSTRAINLSSCSWQTNTFTTTGSGSVRIYGDGSRINQNNAWGIASGVLNITTVSGDIYLEGKGNTNGPTNARGVALGSVANLTSTSGNISVVDTTNGSQAGYAGLYVGATTTITTNGSANIQGDKFTNTTLVLNTPSATIQSYTTSSFTGTFTTGAITATSCANLTIGAPGNTAAITVSSALADAGNINLNAGALALNAAITAAGNLAISATGAVTQAAAITASGLSLNGAGTFTLTNANNNVSSIAAGSSAAKVGSLSYVDLSGGLTVGTVGSTAGIYSTGAVSVSTTTGDITVTAPVVSDYATGNSVALSANTSAAAGGGSLSFSGSGAVTVASTANSSLNSGAQSVNRISFDAQGGVAVADQLFTSGATITLPAAPARPGYSFDGWFATATGGTPLSSSYVTGNSAVTVYAQWTATDRLIRAFKVDGTGSVRTITGSGLDTVKSVLVGGKAAGIVSATDSSMTISLPDLAAGTYDLQLIGARLSFALGGGVVIDANEPAAGSVVAAVPGFVGKSTALSASQKSAIAKASAGATVLTCTTYYVSVATAAERALAAARAQAACGYAKALSKSAKVTVLTVQVFATNPLLGKVSVAAKH